MDDRHIIVVYKNKHKYKIPFCQLVDDLGFLIPIQKSLPQSKDSITLRIQIGCIQKLITHFGVNNGVSMWECLKIYIRHHNNLHNINELDGGISTIEMIPHIESKRNLLPNEGLEKIPKNDRIKKSI